MYAIWPLPGDTVRVSRSIGSGEGLLENFCKEEKDSKNPRNTVLNPIPGQRVLLDEPEFTNLLQKARRPGTANITEILLSLFDGDDWSPKTRSRSIQVVQPFFCLFTATTPESLELTLQDVDIDSGLIPRFATFWCTAREPMAYPPPPDMDIMEGLVRELQEIGGYAAQIGASQGVLHLSRQSLAEWEAAFHDFTIETRQAPKAVGAIMTRVPTLVMKWALLYAIQAGHSTIEMDDLVWAILVGTYLMETARLVPAYVSKAPVARVEARILASLGRFPGQWLSARDLHQLVGGRIKAADLRQSLDSLMELGVINRANSSSGRSSVFQLVEC